jgi:hypothetical protein
MVFGTHTLIGLVTVVIAVFALFYIFFNIDQIVNKCKVEPELNICKYLSGFTLPVIIILLIIAGFILIISTVGYVLLTS